LNSVFPVAGMVALPVPLYARRRSATESTLSKRERGWNVWCFEEVIISMSTLF